MKRPNLLEELYWFRLLKRNKILNNKNKNKSKLKMLKMALIRMILIFKLKMKIRIIKDKILFTSTMLSRHIRNLSTPTQHGTQFKFMVDEALEHRGS